MAYVLFGGSPADFAVITTSVNAAAGGNVDALVLSGGVDLEAWGAGAAGSQVTDLLLFTGSYTVGGAAAPSGVFPSQSDGTVLVWAQDTVGELWVTGSGSSGQRWILRPVNLNTRVNAIELQAYIPDADRGVADGVATLDGTGKVPSAQLPSIATGVDSVNTLTGAVSLTEANTGFTPNTRSISAGTGLTGGGTLAANRTVSAVFGSSAGTVAEGNHTHGGFTTSPRPVFAQVIASGAPTEWITAAAADPYTWVCDGTNDEVQINLAIDAAAPKQGASAPNNPSSPATAKHLGMVQMSGGRFNIGSAGIKIRTGVHLNGAGIGSTELRAVSCNQPGLISLANITDHLTHISNLYLNGNSGGGGTCSAINIDMTAGASTSDYPDTNADAYHHIHDLYIDEFRGTGRHGIYLHAGSGDNNRGNIIDRIQIRDTTSGSGIYLSAASDSFISNCHVGGSGLYGYHIATGNTKISNCKSFYSNTAGFYFSSGRGIVSGCESQDDSTGFFFDGSPYAASGLIADTCDVAGIRVSTSTLVLVGFNVFLRSGGRYATQQRGVYYDASYTNCTLIGNVENSGITTPISGPVPTGTNFVTVS